MTASTSQPLPTPNSDQLKSAVRSVPFKIALLSSAVLAIGALASHYTDQRSTSSYTQVCFKPAAKIARKGRNYCTARQRYWIADGILRQWERREPELYGKLTRLDTLPPETANKWQYGALTLGGGLLMAGLGAARLALIGRLSPGYRKEIQAQWHRDAVRNGVQMASDAIDGRYAVMNKLANAEAQYGRTQAALLTPDEILASQQAFLDSESAARQHGQQQAQEMMGPQRQPELPGQSLSDITNPADKVTAGDAAPLPSDPAAGSDDGQDTAHILGRIARSDASTALCGDPGTGKSTITNDYIRRVQASSPNADIRVLAVKNDAFCGLRDAGKVTRFIGQDALAKAQEFFVQVRHEYERRLNLPEPQRATLAPFVLVLDDWLSIAASLTARVRELEIDFGQILFDVLIIGREYNIKFFACLHSLNLAAIGIKQLDQNTRACLNLILLGNRYRKDGREIDAYKVIEQMFATPQAITHPKDRESLRALYQRLKALSREQLRPVLFAYVGQYFLGMVPPMNKETATPDTTTSSPAAPPPPDVSPDDPRAIEFYERLVRQSPGFGTNPSVAPAAPEDALPPQAQEIYAYVRERGGAMEALTIAKNKGLPIATVRDLLRQLIVREKAEPWGNDGIRLH